MKFKIFFGIIVFGICLGSINCTNDVVCYYNSRSIYRTDQAKMAIQNLKDGLQFCTHLIYGFAGINPVNYKIESMDETLELPTNQNHYQEITKLKNNYPNLKKVLLSVGGGVDGDYEKYLKLLESPNSMKNFINSAYSFVKTYDFDGIDLAWQFPETKPKQIRSLIGKIWNAVKIIKSKPDDKEEEHRQQFTQLVKQLKSIMDRDHLSVTLTVLPNVNSTVYHDVTNLINNVDQVHLLAFDYYTPERNPNEADYFAPLKELIDRRPDCNAEFLVNFWHSRATKQTSKIFLGIPTFGRTWKMTSNSQPSGIPPLEVDGPGEAGLYTKQKGIIGYPEVCTKTKQGKEGSSELRVVPDPQQRAGTYAFRLPGTKDGIWVSYEDANTANNKAKYAKTKGLGGVAIYDLSLDDFKGLCDGSKYPLLSTVKQSLNN